MNERILTSVETDGDFTHHKYETPHGVARQTCRFDRDYNTTFDGYWVVTLRRRKCESAWVCHEATAIKMICGNLLSHEVTS